MKEQGEPHVVAYVEWIDSGVVGDTWATREEIEERLQDARDPIRSAGLLMDEADDGILLALSSNDTHGDIGLAFWIPKSAIVRLDKWIPTPGVDSPE